MQPQPPPILPWQASLIDHRAFSHGAWMGLGCGMWDSIPGNHYPFPPEWALEAIHFHFPKGRSLWWKLGTDGEDGQRDFFWWRYKGKRECDALEASCMPQCEQRTWWGKSLRWGQEVAGSWEFEGSWGVTANVSAVSWLGLSEGGMGREEGWGPFYILLKCWGQGLRQREESGGKSFWGGDWTRWGSGWCRRMGFRRAWNETESWLLLSRLQVPSGGLYTWGWVARCQLWLFPHTLAGNSSHPFWGWLLEAWPPPSASFPVEKALAPEWPGALGKGRGRPSYHGNLVTHCISLLLWTCGDFPLCLTTDWWAFPECLPSRCFVSRAFVFMDNQWVLILPFHFPGCSFFFFESSAQDVIDARVGSSMHLPCWYNSGAIYFLPERERIEDAFFLYGNSIFLSHNPVTWYLVCPHQKLSFKTVDFISCV